MSNAVTDVSFSEREANDGPAVGHKTSRKLHWDVDECRLRYARSLAREPRRASVSFNAVRTVEAAAALKWKRKIERKRRRARPDRVGSGRADVCMYWGGQADGRSDRQADREASARRGERAGGEGQG